jgi:hypothetical protein
MKIICSFILLSLIFLYSCRDSVQLPPVDHSNINKKKNETLLNMNNYVVRRNQELISQFVKRTKLEMKETGSGLWYGIYEKGKGKVVNKGNKVEFSYILKLLDGTPVDSAWLGKPKIFRSEELKPAWKKEFFCSMKEIMRFSLFLLTLHLVILVIRRKFLREPFYFMIFTSYLLIRSK